MTESLPYATYLLVDPVTKFKTCKKRVLTILKKAGVALRPSGRSKGVQ